MSSKGDRTFIVDTMGAAVNLEKQTMRTVWNLLPRTLPSSPWIKFFVFTNCYMDRLKPENLYLLS